MRHISEIAVKDALELSDWRHLRKDHFLQLLSMFPDMDTEVALKIVSQIPEITGLARTALDDAASAYDVALGANARSTDIVHEIQMGRLALLKIELGRDDLNPAERLQILGEVRDVHESALRKDTENKLFLSEQLDKRLFLVSVASVATAAVVLMAAARSGAKVPAYGRLT